MTQPAYINYGEIRQRQRTHVLRQTEVPVDHAVSLPLPTLRWGRPAYACFASPAIRRPGQPSGSCSQITGSAAQPACRTHTFSVLSQVKPSGPNH